MKLLINSENVSFTLEEEKNLYDVMIALSHHVMSSGAMITSARADGVDVLMADANTLKNVAVETIKELEIDARLQREDEQLSVLVQYLRSLALIAEKLKDDRTVQRVVRKDDIYAMAIAMDRYAKNKMPQYFSAREMFLRACGDLGFLGGDSSAITYDENAVRIIRILSEILAMHAEQKEATKRGAKAINEEMEAQLAAMRKIPELINAGEDANLMRCFISSAECISLWLHALAMTKREEQKWHGKHRDFSLGLRAHLAELSEALEVKDWVTVNDVLEYEIIPAIETHVRAAQHDLE